MKHRSKITGSFLQRIRFWTDGFTLIELLMVVAVLALVGAGAVVFTLNTEETVGKELVQAEIRAVRDALLQFKGDTGFLPRTGPFDLAGSGSGQAAAPPGGERWFYSPANFNQLIDAPRDTAGKPVLPWNPDTGRGWRGPYLKKADGYVNVGGGLHTNGSGSPTAGGLLKGVDAVADPFLNDPDGACFVWHLLDGGSGSPHRCGRPFYLFDWDDPQWARLVSAGPNGIYEAQDYATHSNSSVEIGDDIVLFLFR